MSRDQSATPPAVPAPLDHSFRRAHRDSVDPVLGGVAGGLAAHLGVSVLVVRLAFVLATGFGGLGAAVYAALWLVLPARRQAEEAPGLAAARRDGRRPGRIRRLTDLGPLVTAAVLGIGLLLLVEGVLGQSAGRWPLLLAVGGTALLWRQADEAQRERWLDTTGRIHPRRVVLGRGGWAAYSRLVLGAGSIIAAVFVFSLRSGSFAVARDISLAALVGVVGIGIVAGPWIFRLATELTEERAARVRSQDRADVAAHLHDSVLQTLALIQRNAENAGTVSRLARSQERDLRSWLFTGEVVDGSTLGGALREVAATVEDDHGVSVDVVSVGDRDLDETLSPVVAAAREAISNAARHAGVAQVDVYAEVTADRVAVFVRDRGRGFDLDAVPEDRLGVRGSIVDRLQRHGGSARIRSAPGEGTEVRLLLGAAHPPTASTPRPTEDR